MCSVIIIRESFACTIGFNKFFIHIYVYMFNCEQRNKGFALVYLLTNMGIRRRKKIVYNIVEFKRRELGNSYCLELILILA